MNTSSQRKLDAEQTNGVYVLAIESMSETSIVRSKTDEAYVDRVRIKTTNGDSQYISADPRFETEVTDYSIETEDHITTLYLHY